ncbi:helix-turn-helix transcriptional regulator [Lactovum odontotermitis]
MTVLDRLKELAKKRGKSIKEIAVELGFGESTVYRWDKMNPRGADLEKFADYFHVTVDYLLGREEFPFKDEDLTEMIDRSAKFDGKELPDAAKEGMKDVLRAYLIGKYGK